MTEPVLVFSCRRGSDTTRCSTAGCDGIAVGRCTFALRGRLEGKTCDRPLCAKCAAGGTICLAHQKLVKP